MWESSFWSFPTDLRACLSSLSRAYSSLGLFLSNKLSPALKSSRTWLWLEGDPEVFPSTPGPSIRASGPKSPSGLSSPTLLSSTPDAGSPPESELPAASIAPSALKPLQFPPERGEDRLHKIRSRLRRGLHAHGRNPVQSGGGREELLCDLLGGYLGETNTSWWTWAPETTTRSTGLSLASKSSLTLWRQFTEECRRARGSWFLRKTTPPSTSTEKAENEERNKALGNRGRNPRRRKLGLPGGSLLRDQDSPEKASQGKGESARRPPEKPGLPGGSPPRNQDSPGEVSRGTQDS
ncbi:hypothetical protein HWI79_2694, partial [Cryptosporidium felis]